MPALLVFGGFESAAEVLSLLKPKIPVVLASFDYPFKASRQLSFPGSLKDLPEAKRVFPDTVAGIHELVNRVRALPQVDPSRIFLVGASFGAPFALAAAAEQAKISGLVIVQGFGKLAETARSVLLRAWLPRYGWIARPASWLLVQGLDWYLGVRDPEWYAERVPRGLRVLMIAAENDSFVPLESTESLASALLRAGSVLERVQLPGDHLKPGSDREIDAIGTRIQDWIKGP